jgi:hypothetical protein
MLFALVTVVALVAGPAGAQEKPKDPTGPAPIVRKAIKFFELLLRIDGVKLVRPNSSGVFEPFGAVQCCAAQAGVDNSRWPLASESWMDFTGANMFHFRMGPFYGDADHEPEWADIGGPYIDSGPDFNPAFWTKVRALLNHAGRNKANVEINVIDTWYCKRAASNWGDEQMPWPQDDIDACGKWGTDVQERYIRKVVSETGCYANVIYVTDNEGGQIRGHARAWYDFVYATIRDEEQKSGCGVVHLIGTNTEEFADGPFDYVATHAREPLTQPIAGKHTENNERNPAFSPEQEYANFCAARRAGLNYWYWRDAMSDAEAEQTLNLFRSGCNTPPNGAMQPNSAVRGCSNWSWWDPVYQPSADSCASFCTQNGANACEWNQNGDCYVEFGNGCYVQSGFPGWSAAVFGGPPSSQMQPNSAVRGCSDWSWWDPVYQSSADSCAGFCTQNGANACEWYQNGDCYVEFGNGCYVQSGFPGWSAAIIR